MKNILNKVYFHPLFLLTVLVFIFIGKFKFLSYFMILITVHELGHILVSIIFRWNIEKVVILPFGGLTIYNEILNRPLLQEFLVAVAGISVQMIVYVLIKNNINYNYFQAINYFIIIFNLIPIYPLDGSKILNVLFNKIFSFKKSILLTLIVSYILIIVLSISLFNINKIFTVVLIFLLIESNKLYKSRNHLFNKFLLERYLGEYKFRKEKIIDKIDEMKKDYRHLFYIDNKYLTEKYYLMKMFDIKRNL